MDDSRLDEPAAVFRRRVVSLNAFDQRRQFHEIGPRPRDEHQFKFPDH
jgi:hypothetical protein